MAAEVTGWQAHYLFAALDEAQRRRVRTHGRPRRLEAGQRLFSQGGQARYFWWVETGQVKLYRLSRDGHQKIMGLVEARQSFAEGILFMDTPRYPVNAEAIMASEVFGFERDTYLDVLETSFPTCQALLRRMVRRTQRHLDEIEALTIQNARYRLVHYLLRLHEKGAEGPIILPARKQLIAAQLAMQPETLSRLFRELEGDGLIEVSGGTVKLADPEMLERSL